MLVYRPSRIKKKITHLPRCPDESQSLTGHRRSEGATGLGGNAGDRVMAARAFANLMSSLLKCFVIM